MENTISSDGDLSGLLLPFAAFPIDSIVI
jgi:hypothetical protein